MIRRPGSSGSASEAARAPSEPHPPGNVLTRWVDKLAQRIAPHKHDPDNPLGPNRLTHERPFFESKGFAFGLEYGLTVSELHQLRTHEGVEMIHVVNPDGSSNLELVLARKQLGHNQRLELQGPALNTSLTPGQLPLGARFVGVGLTADLVDHEAKEAVSYTLELKATERTAFELAALVTPTGLQEAGRLLAASPLGGSVSQVVAEGFAGAVPVVSALIAFSSLRWAIKTVRSEQATQASKTFAVAHAFFDAVRILLPLAGVLGNAALVGIAAGVAYAKARGAASGAIGPPGMQVAPAT